VGRALDGADLGNDDGWTGIGRAGGRVAVVQVGVVLVGVEAVRATRQALGRQRRIVVQARPRALGVRRARVPLVAHGVDETPVYADADRVRGAILDQVRIGAAVEVAVRCRRRIGADHEVVARRERRARKRDRPVDRRAASGSVDELDRVAGEGDGCAADVLQLEELGRVGRGLVVVDLIDDE
jgi:hypothetical protein